MTVEYVSDDADLPISTNKAKALVLEAMRLLDLHGRLRIQERELHNGRVFIITIELPLEDMSTSFRDLKRHGLRHRG